MLHGSILVFELLYPVELTPPFSFEIDFKVKDFLENIITQLIEGNYLNEERFAKAYTRGKFNQKGWGRIKIKQGLKFKNVSPVLIKKALQTIDLTDYMATLTQVIEKKERTLTEKNDRKRQYKLQQ
ncbi:MAG: RecX family transcriptional regulator, partial [Chryseobacterium sp.]